MSDTSIKNSSYPMELVGLIVKTNNFDTNLTVDLATTKGGSFQKVYNVKYQRKDASMSNEMTLTVACEDFYTKLIIPNNKDDMIELVSYVFNAMRGFHITKRELKESES